MKKKKNNKIKLKSKKFITIFSISAIFIAIFLTRLTFLFTELSNLPDAPDDGIAYPVRGIDVSHYQGNIDWPVLANQNLAFAFIKATEGSNHLDTKFTYNWEQAQKTHLKVGAYHFMSFESSGKTQAENFIKNVPKIKGMLPPVVDVEYYGQFLTNHPAQDTVDEILKPLLEALENHYGTKPILYVNTTIYNTYIKGQYDNDIWLADLSFPDTLPDGKSWEFLQYTFEGKLDGYSGYIPHLDLNVYRGTKWDFVKKY